MRRFYPLLLLFLFACQSPQDVKDSQYYNMCPPGNACLSPVFAVNRLDHDISVRYDIKKRRFVMADNDPNAIILHQGEVADLVRMQQSVFATPGPESRGTPALHPYTGP